MSDLDQLILHPLGLYKLNTFIKHTGVAESTWRRFGREGRAPRPVARFERTTISKPRSSLYRGADVIAWLADPVGWQEAHKKITPLRACSGVFGFACLTDQMHHHQNDQP